MGGMWGGIAYQWWGNTHVHLCLISLSSPDSPQVVLVYGLVGQVRRWRGKEGIPTPTGNCVSVLGSYAAEGPSISCRANLVVIC